MITQLNATKVWNIPYDYRVSNYKKKELVKKKVKIMYKENRRPYC